MGKWVCVCGGGCRCAEVGVGVIGEGVMWEMGAGDGAWKDRGCGKGGCEEEG